MKKCLIVDDEMQNCYLLDQILRGYGYETIIANNGAEALDKASQDAPDLIVSDILMPVMDGYDLCRKLKSDDTLKHIPFVFYTATYTETADEKFAMSLGAVRFIIKPQEPETLMNIINEVLEENYAVKQVATKPLGEEMEFFRQHNEILFSKLEKKMRDLETAKRKMECLEEQYRLSFENVTDIVWTTDIDLIIRKISPSVEKILGYKPQDFIGRPFSDFGNLLTADSMERAIDEICQVLKGKTIPASVYSLVARDGTVKHCEISGSPIFRSGGEIVGMVSVIRDITDRKQAEEALRESELKYRSLVDQSLFGILIVQDGRVMYANNVIIEQSRYSADELMALSPIQLMELIHPDDRDIVWSRMLNRMAGTMEAERNECRFIAKDGSVLWTDVHTKVIVFLGKPALQMCIVDTTERKRTEQELQFKNVILSTQQEVSIDGILVVDEKARILSYNRRFIEMWGLPAKLVEAGVDEPVLEFVTAQMADPRSFLQRVQSLYEHEQDTSRDELILADSRVFDRYSAPMFGSDERYYGRVWYFRDITDRKQAEEALRKSEEYFRAITENANDVLFILDGKGNITYCSLSVERIMGYKPQELVGLNALDLIIPEDHVRANKNFGKALRTKDIGIPNSFRVRHKNGSVLIMEGIGKNLFNNPVVGGFVMNVRDVGDRKRAEARLESERTLLRNLIDNVPDRIYAKDTEGRFIICNEAMIRRMGKTSMTEIVGKSDFDLLPPEMAQQFYTDEQAVIRTGKPIINREQPLAIEGDKITRWNLSSKVPLRDKQGNTIGIVGVGREITEIKQAEEKLRKSEASFQDLFNEAPVGYFEYDTQGCITRVNRTELDILGYQLEEMIGQPVWKFIVEEEVSREQILAKLAGTIAPFRGFERTYRRKDGTVFPFLIQDRLIKDEGGNVTGIRCAVQDITELKGAEKQLRDILESLRKAFGTTIQVMVSAVETRDPYTAGHQVRSAGIARTIATEMGLSSEKIEGIRMASAIHDIGKLSIPAEILTKPVKLTGIELSLIQEHPRKGYEILKDVESPWPLAEIIYQHHERMDGSGYPRNLKGDEILIEARIIAVADVVESMASHRPYRPALGIDAALNEIGKNKGILYDATVVDACLRLFLEKGFKLGNT